MRTLWTWVSTFWRIGFVATVLLGHGPPVAAQTDGRKEVSVGWTSPDTVALEAAGAFAVPELVPAGDVLYVLTETVNESQLLGRPSMTEQSARYRLPSTIWVGRVTDPGFQNIRSVGQPAGENLPAGSPPFQPTGSAGPGGSLHLAWVEAHPDSVANYKQTDVQSPFAQRVYYARYDGTSWSRPQMLYRSLDRENYGLANLGWYDDLKGALQVGPDGEPHVVFDHMWRPISIHLSRQERPWRVDTMQYDRGERFKVGSRDMAIGKNGHLVVAYEAFGGEEAIENSQVRVARSTDGGDTWTGTTVLGPEQRIKNEKAGGSPRHVRVAGHPNDTLHVVWGRKTKMNTFSAQELWHAWSADGGASWSVSSPLNLPQNSSFDDLYVVTDGCGTLHVLTQLRHLQEVGTSSDLYYATWRSEDGWTELQSVMPGSAYVHGAALAPWKGHLHLMWSQSPLPFKLEQEHTAPVTVFRRSRRLCPAGGK